MKTAPAILLTLAIALPATWLASRQFAGHAHAPSPSPAAERKAPGERKPLYYQSAMHPWIKSEKPGRCTICGMELTPVYEGEAGPDADGGELVSLTQSMIQVMNVETAEAKIQPIQKTLSFAGTINDDESRRRALSAYIPGRIEKLYVTFAGAEVKQGEPLAEFYSPILLQAEREHRTLTGDLRAATALRLQQMGLTPGQIAALPEKGGEKLTSEILAPIGGTVVEKSVLEGQYVQEGEKLFEIADFSTMWFQFRVYEQDLPWIQRGLKVEVSTPAAPGRAFVGELTFIDPNFDQATRSTLARVELENPVVDGRRLLLHRLYADGVVQLEAAEALAVPRAAVIQTGPQAVVYVDEGGGNYARRVIKIGRRGDRVVEVTSGLAEGEKVVVNGNLLIDGQAEMNRSFAQATHDDAWSRASAEPLKEDEKQALAEFIKVNDALSLALSKDDLAAYEAASGESMAATDALVAALKNRAELEDILTHVAEARHLHGAKDLAAARKAYHPFANASARTLDLLQFSEGAPPFQVFECPMVNQAVPGAPSRGRWVQAGGREIANPYFGAEMLECGRRVIP